MPEFRLKFSLNIYRNAGYFALFVLLFNIAWNALPAIFSTAFFDRPVNEAWFGKFFVMAHLWALLGLFLMIVVGYILARRLLIVNPGRFLARQEWQEFDKNYQTNFFERLSKLCWMPNLALFILIVGSLVFWPLFALLHARVSSYWVIAIALIFLVFSFGLLRYYSKFKKQLKKEILGYMNHSVSGSHFNSDLIYLDGDGTFEQTPFLIDYGIPNRRLKRDEALLSKTGIQLKFSNDSRWNFKIEDRLNGQMVFSAPDLDTCFEQRFKVSGVTVSELPNAFKQKLLESQRHIFITVQGGVIRQQLGLIHIAGFYSLPGVFLFLGFLSDLGKTLRSK